MAAREIGDVPYSAPASRRELRELQSRSTSRRPRPVGRTRAPKSGVPARSLRQRLARKAFSGAALLFAGALLVGTTVPANAFLTQDPLAESTESFEMQSQTLTVDADSAAAAAPVTRDALTVTSYAEVLRLKYGNRDYSYTVGTGSIRWPFPYAVRISDGYGNRVSPCRGCSTFHKGVDFLPGDGAPIYAIADGVVSYAEDSNGGFGNHVFIEHTVNGQTVTSVYAHMQAASSPLAIGDVVKVGDFVGLVGSTGSVTAPHLHFEIRLDGVAVDPFAWLRANAN